MEDYLPPGSKMNVSKGSLYRAVTFTNKDKTLLYVEGNVSFEINNISSIDHAEEPVYVSGIKTATKHIFTIRTEN